MINKRKFIFRIIALSSVLIIFFQINNKIKSFNIDENASNEAADKSDVSVFAPNSTSSNKTSSTSKSKQYTVVIDAGHGGYDAGSIGSKGVKEKDTTLPVALKLGSILESKGVKVIYTRKTDNISLPKNERANLAARADISNKANADLFISIHNNSSIFKSAKGAETYYYPFSSKCKSLASNIQSQIIGDMKRYNRGIKTSTFYVLRYVKAPAVLVELGFISNTTEETQLSNANYQSQFANAIAKGILKYLGK
jgi:N-acetylmuramoyl-L-alanine amidase